MRRKWILLPLLGVLGLSSCATMPTGPSVMVMPSPGKTFEAFQAEDMTCRQWAAQQTGITPNDTANQNLFTSAAIGTVLGAGLGAAIGAASGNPGVGAAIGAASGAVGGTAVGAGPAYASGWEVQRRYDMAYQQCMYTKGNQLPTVVRGSGGGYWVVTPPPPRAYYPPPPPPPGWAPTPEAPPPSAYLSPPPPPQ